MREAESETALRPDPVVFHRSRMIVMTTRSPHPLTRNGSSEKRLSFAPFRLHRRWRASAHPVTSISAPNSASLAAIWAMLRASSMPRWWWPTSGSLSPCSIADIPPFQPWRSWKGFLMLQ
eukprot:7376594-Prymnesium_polylepis.1